MGINITNIKGRYDTFSHVLSYPQRPIIETKIMKHINLDKLPNGINVIVAIASYGGFNQENFVGAFQKASGNYAIFCKTTSYTDVGSSLEQDILVFEISPDGSIVKSSVIAV